MRASCCGVAGLPAVGAGLASNLAVHLIDRVQWAPISQGPVTPSQIRGNLRLLLVFFERVARIERFKI